ncbi:hypothetical protein LIER_30327 [Lithospermum erythrorhizon]|uniref:Uncharacterized protein n=1 Tax=Lithospermum erythrorhizon TaxID=34254 RepID=A0AAV3RSH1_LITER
MTSIDDTTDKTTEPSGVSEKSAGVSGNDVLEAGNVDVSHADIVTESVKSSSIKDLSKAVDPSEEHY